MHAILNRSTILAAGIALGTLIVLLAILPGQADGAAVGADAAAALSAPIHQDEALSAEESDTPVYPGAGRLNTPGEAPGKCEDCAESPRAAANPAAELASGGPDEFGYAYTDSNDENGPNYNFVDIRDSGNLIYLYDDDYQGPFDLGFDFPFYGETKAEVYVSSNGFIGFSPDGMTAYFGSCPIVDPYIPNDIIALVWDDLYPDTYFGGGVHYQSFDTCPYNGSGACFVVQYSDIYNFYGGFAGTFQAILFENSDILVQFADAGNENGAYSTTGIENATGTDGLTYACRQSDSLTDELAILFSRPSLRVEKRVSESLPAAGEPLTFDIELNNNADHGLSAVAVDDMLPPDVLMYGPVTISPAHPEAELAQTQADLPRLVENLDLAEGESVIVSLPATLTAGINGARLNQVVATSPDVQDPVSAEAGFLVLRDCRDVANVVQDCSFESGGLTQWMATDVISPLLSIQVAGAGVDTQYGQFTSDPIRGQFAVVHGFDGEGPGTIELAQDMALPTDATSVEFAYRVGYDLATYYAYVSRSFVVVIEPEGGGPYPLQETVVYVAEAGRDLSDSGDLFGSVDISDFAGTSVRLIFRWYVPQSFSGPGMFQLDNVIVNTASPPTFANSPRTNARTGAEYVHTVLTTDADTGESRVFTAPTLPSWLQLVDNGDGSAMLSGVPKMTETGDHAVVIQVTDERGMSAQQTFSISVEMGSDGLYLPTVMNSAVE